MTAAATVARLDRRMIGAPRTSPYFRAEAGAR